MIPTAGKNVYSADEHKLSTTTRSVVLGLIYVAGLILIIYIAKFFIVCEDEQQKGQLDEATLRGFRIFLYGFIAAIVWSFAYHFYNIAVDIEIHLRELVFQGRTQPKQAEELQVLGQLILNSNYQKSMSQAGNLKSGKEVKKNVTK